ncbi:hypothetical protein EYC84_002522 [Monilinia fructicola]|uniref:Uncharacterized protein n=1 Tax=Monilinia fructicola TaxID=38448 RepID=A0A5M9JP67_MONFR|nr:hypothetical protein EYC84_002522 [Monilinia fructicola]
MAHERFQFDEMIMIRRKSIVDGMRCSNYTASICISRKIGILKVYQYIIPLLIHYCTIPLQHFLGEWVNFQGALYLEYGRFGSIAKEF